jgi:hypothetical protein
LTFLAISGILMPFQPQAVFLAEDARKKERSSEYSLISGRYRISLPGSQAATEGVKTLTTSGIYQLNNYRNSELSFIRFVVL